MSNSVSTRVWRESVQTKTRRLLLVKIADNVNNDGFGFAGNEYLAENVLISVRQVQRLIDQIQGTGELYVRSGNGRSNKNETLITVGLSYEAIKNRLETYFEMSPFDAENVTLSILEKRAGKGDILKQERVTKSSIKGDISDASKGDESAPIQETSSLTVLTDNSLTENALKTLAKSANATLPGESSVNELNAQLEQTRIDQESTLPVGQPASKPEANPPSVPAVSPLPDAPKGFKWVTSSDSRTEFAHLRKLKNSRGCLCQASIRGSNDYQTELGSRKPCEACQAKVSVKVTDEWPQYGALMVMVHKYGFNAAPDDASKGRAGDATKALLKGYPETTIDELQRFCTEWTADGFPCGVKTLPSAFGRWKSKPTNGTPASTASYLDGIPDYGDENPYQSQFKAGNVINSAWDGTIDDLEVKMGKSTFNNRVKGLRLVEVTGDNPKLFIAEAQNEFQQQYILKHLMHSLLKTLEDRARCKVRVEVRIGAKAS